MTYDEAVDYLLSLGHETLAMKLGLENVSRLLVQLDNPQKSFPSVQIAGTNGKGSTAAMVESICEAAGLRVGLFTSPHLISITERVRVASVDISRDRFAATATLVREAALACSRETGALATFFEQVTAIALVYFRDAEVDLAILETGLGGRLDATTAVRADTVAITQIALDHQEYLGTTVREIASEKAAIIRPGARAIVAADLAPEAADVIEERCRATGVDPSYATKDFEVEGSCGDGRLQVTFRTQQAEYPNVCLALRGRHQIANAAIAIAIAETLRHRGFTICGSAISAGLARAKHPGRLEFDENQSPRVLFDGAHNAAGARALRKYFDEFVSEPITMVFGAMREKQLEKICAELFPVATNIVLTEPDNARAAGVDELIRAVPVPGTSSTITVAPSARDAVVIARSLTKSGGLICVTGSLYLVGEVKRILSSLASQHVP